MQYRVFQYQLPAPPELEDLNSFLAGHRVVAVTQYLGSAAGSSMLVFVVETVGAPYGDQASSKPRVDYRAELGGEDFAVFNQLRAWRKQVAEADGVPVYTVFTNAQLAEMVTARANSLHALREIDGVGPARAEKYGAALLAILAPSSGGGTPAAAQNEAAADDQRQEP